MPADFEDLLAEARITQRALAEWLGYASNTPLSRIATGKRPLPPELREWLERRAADPPPQIRDR